MDEREFVRLYGELVRRGRVPFARASAPEEDMGEEERMQDVDRLLCQWGAQMREASAPARLVQSILLKATSSGFKPRGGE